MILFSVLKKSVIEQFRDYKALLLTLLSPIIFMTIFGLAFGQGFYTYKVSITNHDAGELGKAFIQTIDECKYPNNNKVFELTYIDGDADKIKKDINNQKYLANITIPSDFTKSLNSNDISQAKTKVIISGNPSNLSYDIIQNFLSNYISEFEQKYRGIERSIEIKYADTAEAKTKSEFQGMAPGFIVFSVFFLLILSSMVLTKEIENKTMPRMVFSKLKSWHLYAGISLSQLLLAVIMIPMVFLAAYFLGFKPEGSYLLGFLISLIATLSAIGIGMLIAAFCKTSLEAFIIGNIVITPMLFLAGIFFKVPPIKLFTIAGKDVELLSLMPTLESVTAMNKVLLGKSSFLGVLPEIIILLVLAIGYFLLGVLLFSKRYKKRMI